MARQVATLEGVTAAAAAIAASGTEPTLTLVQERTGGSYTTVKRHLEAWQLNQKAVAAVDVPADVQSRGHALSKDLYAIALREAQEAVSQPLELAARTLMDVKNQVAIAEAEVQRLEDIEQRQANQIECLESNVRDLELNSAAQLATVVERTAVIQRLESQFAETQAKLRECQGELAGARAATKITEALCARFELSNASCQASQRRAATEQDLPPPLA